MEPVVTLASDPFSRGEEIARLAAEDLGFPLVGREVFEAAAASAGTDPGTILAAVREPPGFLGRGGEDRKRHLAALGAALAQRILPGGAIYDGPAGHHLVHGVSHVVRVKVTAGAADRARVRAGVTGEAPAKAAREIERDDRRRFRTCREIFGRDCGDPALYDLVLDTSKTPPADAAKRLAAEARLPRYRPQSFSTGCAANLELALRIRWALSGLDPDVLVSVTDGKARLRTRAAESPDGRLGRAMREAALAEPGVRAVEVETAEDLFGGRGRLIR